MGIVSFFVFDTVGYLLLFIVMYGVFGAIWSFIGISEITSITRNNTTLIDVEIESILFEPI